MTIHDNETSLELTRPIGEETLLTQETEEPLAGPEGALNFLTFVGNDERKLLTLLAVNHSGSPQGKTGLFRSLKDLCGGQIPGNLSQPFEYCQDSLSVSDVVTETTAIVDKFGKVPTQVKAFEITKQGKEFGLSFAGALLMWSIEHPDLSLNILGSTSSKRSVRAPVVRYWALYDLATSKDDPKGPSIQYLAEHVPMASGTKMAMIRRFEQLGLVDKENSQNQNHRQFKIIQPEYIEGERKPRFDHLKAETQILFNTLKSAHAIKDEWEKDEFLKYMMELHPYIDADTLKKARLRLDNALAPSGTNLRGVVEDISGRNYQGMTKVTLRPEVASAVNELVTIVDRFCSNDQTIFEEGRRFAESITANPVIFRELYEKAFKNSNRATKDEDLEKRLLGIVKSGSYDIASASAIRDAYAKETGRNISTGSINTKLGQLVTRGALQSEDLPQSKLKQNTLRRYS